MTDDRSDSTLPRTDEEWREVLTPEEFDVLRNQGTEPRFSGEFLNTDDEGVYTCVGCGAELFTSETKFDDESSAWPSFYDAEKGSVELRPDHSHGMRRTEVVCANCGGHLGHVFDDGPNPTGKRFCINSVALDFEDEN